MKEYMKKEKEKEKNTKMKKKIKKKKLTNMKNKKKQNEPPLKSILVYHDINENCGMESKDGNRTLETKESSYIFFYQRFLD